MIGIYKITNILNNKIYIGQSNNIQRRFSEHKTRGVKSSIPVDVAIAKHGKENFCFEIVEEVLLEELNSHEEFWIIFYNSKKNGYNCSDGGDFQSVGENNGRAILSEIEIKEIRTSYSNHSRRKEVYEKYKDKITFLTFASIWDGKQWSHIMPEVFTEKNKRFYSFEATNGALSPNAIFTEEEVILFRKRYVKETAKEIYDSLIIKNGAFQTFQRMLWGKTYKNLPIYNKKKKEWINL